MNLNENQKKVIVNDAVIQAEATVKQQFELIKKYVDLRNPDNYLARYSEYQMKRKCITLKINELDMKIQEKQNEIKITGDKQQKQEANNRQKWIQNQEIMRELIRLNHEKINLQKTIEQLTNIIKRNEQLQK